MAAHCAGEQGKFWEMSHKIFENYRQYSPDTLPGYAGELGLDVAKFEECFASGRHDGAINKRKSEASRANISATPSFLLGYTKPGSTEFKPVELIRGAVAYANFQQKLDKLIQDKEKAK